MTGSSTRPVSQMSLDAIEQLQRELEEQKQALLARKAKRKPGRDTGSRANGKAAPATQKAAAKAPARKRA